MKNCTPRPVGQDQAKIISWIAACNLQETGARMLQTISASTSPGDVVIHTCTVYYSGLEIIPFKFKQTLDSSVLDPQLRSQQSEKL